MRQVTLAFGQRQSESKLDCKQPAPDEKQQGSKQKAIGSLAVEEGSSVNTSKIHPLFTKQVNPKKARVAEKERVSEHVVASQLQKPAKAPPLFRKRTHAAKETPWPGLGESHIQPISDLSKVASSSAIPLEPANRSRNARQDLRSPEEAIWPWHLADPTDNEEVKPRHVRVSNGMHAKETSQASQLWSDASRPHCSADVLGNERQAGYLRDWLRVLQVTGGAAALTENGKMSNGAQETVARQIIKRALKKRKRPSGGRGEMDDFLVGDTEEEEAWYDQFRKGEEIPHIAPEESSAPVQGISSDDDDYTFANASHVTNLIVIAGPSGSGKTAAVYACAEELGFEVFEVYAGMGKRSGHAIMSLVGDLCLNHMVSSGGTGGGAFKSEAGNTQKLKLSFSKNAVNQSPVKKNSSTGRPRQSLILFEEVDVLYEEDKGFWPALIELAAQSRRPLVLTCNDVDAIPIIDLPVQRILNFESPGVETATEYLQEVAARRGHVLHKDRLSALYSDEMRLADRVRQDEDLRLRQHGTLHPDVVLPYSTSAHCDLRQALLQLQFVCAVPQIEDREGQALQTPALDRGGSLREAIRDAEHRSAADVIGKRSHSRSAEILEPEQFGSSSDDVQSPAIALHKNAPNGSEIALAEYGREKIFADALMPSDSIDASEELKRRIAFHQRRLRISRAMNELCVDLWLPPHVRPPNMEALTEYVSIVHKMIKFDDAEEEAHKVHVAQLLEEARKVHQATVESTNGRNDSPTLATAAASLTRMGIRPSRQSSRLLLQRDENGILQLGRREPEFFRWVPLSEEHLLQARKLAPSIDW